VPFAADAKRAAEERLSALVARIAEAHSDAERAGVRLAEAQAALDRAVAVERDASPEGSA
jgi:hypothetical protein